MIIWLTTKTDAVWVGMEQRPCQNVQLESLTEKAQKKLKIGNEWIRETMRIWSIVRKKLNLSNSCICRATKITTDPDFLPSIMDAGYNTWSNKDLMDKP